MKRVTGIGGLFFKAKDPARLQDWYKEHLGISPLPHSPWGEDDDSPLFEYRALDDPQKICYAVYGIFPDDTDYFEPGKQSFMFNFRVENLNALLVLLNEEGITIVGEVREYPFGRFAKIVDPEGNTIELWEPGEGF